VLDLLLRGLALQAGVIAEIALVYLFYTTGWFALRLLTLGRYPDLPLRVADPTARAAPGSRHLVSSVWWVCR
jgi:hypothetical protein